MDGAKRDRTIWPGDMGVSSDSAYATIGDVESSRSSLDTLYGYQNPTNGMMPYVWCLYARRDTHGMLLLLLLLCVMACQTNFCVAASRQYIAHVDHRAWSPTERS